MIKNYFLLLCITQLAFCSEGELVNGVRERTPPISMLMLQGRLGLISPKEFHRLSCEKAFEHAMGTDDEFRQHFELSRHLAINFGRPGWVFLERPEERVRSAWVIPYIGGLSKMDSN